MHDRGDVVLLIATAAQQVGYALQVTIGVQIAGTLLGAKASIQIAADSHVPGIASDEAHMVDLPGQSIQANDVALRDAALPAWVEHPGIERHADHAIALYDGSNLLIAELTVAWDECAAVIVAGEHGALKRDQRLPESLVRQVAQVEDHAAGIHLAQ